MAEKAFTTEMGDGKFGELVPEAVRTSIVGATEGSCSNKPSMKKIVDVDVFVKHVAGLKRERWRRGRRTF